MKAVEKRKLTKSQAVTVWLLIISIILGAAYATVLVIANKRASGGSSSGQSSLKPIDGEAIHNNRLVAYPIVKEASISYIEVENKAGKFGVTRFPNDLGDFIFHYYVDGEEKAIPYTPPIVNAEGAFDYTSLYSIVTNDGIGRMFYLSYLCSSLGYTYFTERIELPEDEEAKELLLREYGLTKSELSKVSFVYGEVDKTTGQTKEETESAHVLLIGNKAISGNGFYFMVDGRDCVYYTDSEYFSFALAGFNNFVKGMLVSAGLDGESVYGPYLTTDFKEWITTVFSESTDAVFTNTQPGYEKFENPNVLVNGKYHTSVDKGLEFDGEFSGYETTENADLSFDLELLKKHPEYQRIKNALVGQTVGSYTGEEILLTLLTELHFSDEKLLSFGENTELRYDYSVSKIESVVSDAKEKTAGVVADTDKLLKVTYRYTVGGVTVKHDCHAVIDLTNLSAEIAAKFIGLTIGEELDTPVEFGVDYTKDNSLSIKEKFVLKGVSAIFDENGAIVDTITENSYINIAYYTVIGDEVGETVTRLYRLADIKDTDKLAPLKTLLLGKGKGSYDTVVYEDSYYYECMREFVTYEISEIEYFVANEIVVSFRFCNVSKRDPFYGDTFFENTLTNDYKLYGLNDGACMEAVKLLGGIGTDSSSAVGFAGETVAVGLTNDNMEKYGLFAHKIYFEMPRGIYDASEEGSESAEDVEDEFSDYAWIRTLGFTLYISDPTYDETGKRIRYIGSDMYDLIAKVDASLFDFVEYSFTDFWARKNMVMMDITKLTELKLEFNMQDLKGSSDFEIDFKEAYYGYSGNKLVVSDEEFAGSSPYDKEIIMVNASSDAFDTKFKEMFGSGEWRDLALVYNETMGGGNTAFYPGSKDTLGAAYFNGVYEILQLTRYLDTLTEQEQAEAYTKTRIMRMHISYRALDDTIKNYTYDFYRLDDRRIMVSFYRSDESGNKIEHLGEVSEFYVSTAAFKKLVNSYIYLLNGEVVDESIHYN